VRWNGSSEPEHPRRSAEPPGKGGFERLLVAAGPGDVAIRPDQQDVGWPVIGAGSADVDAMPPPAVLLSPVLPVLLLELLPPLLAELALCEPEPVEPPEPVEITVREITAPELRDADTPVLD